MPSDRVTEEIKQRLDIVEYIGRSVDLKRAGRTYKACCPFHAEKTPSFVVFPEGRWYCFGACGEGGDIFTYVEKREGLSFAEALRQLAREAGVALEEQSEAQQQARAEQDRLVALCEAAMQQFQAWLRELPEAQHCRDYVEQRGVSPEMVHRFGLGYAPDAWEALLEALGARGYQPQELARAGLVRERDTGGFYDALRDRLIFPIRDVRGRVIGFGGRALHGEQVPKYINSPQTALFDKGRTLYGLDLAKDAIRTEQRAIVVEGYMDVIAAHQAGYANVVASLGTALTSEQLRLLGRYAPSLTLALDADTAGRKAAERGLEVARHLQDQARRAQWERARQGQGKASETEGEIRVLLLPDGKDPDDLFRHEPQRWEQLVAGALPVMDYLISQRLDGVQLEDPVQKARVASDLLPEIAAIESSIVRDHYLQQLARRLQADERVLAQEMVKHLGQRRPAAVRSSDRLPPEPPQGMEESAWDQPPPDAEEWLPLEPVEEPLRNIPAGLDAGAEPRAVEDYLLYLMLEQPGLVEAATQQGLRSDMWQQTENRHLFDALVRRRPQSGSELEEFVEELEPLVERKLRRIVSFYAAHPAIPREEWEEEMATKMAHFLIRYDEQQARQLHYLIDDLQRTPDTDWQALRDLLQQKTTIEQRILQRQRQLIERTRRRKAVEPARL